MQNIDFNELRDKAYQTACYHGFHDCNYSDEHLLMLVITEVSEAIQADRKGKRVRKDAEGTYRHIQKDKFYMFAYENYIEGTVESELADVVIRLLDLAGLREIDIKPYDMAPDVVDYHNLTECCHYICKILTESRKGDKTWVEGIINHVISYILSLAESMDIDILWFIEQKMKYNERREKMHGAKY